MHAYIYIYTYIYIYIYTQSTHTHTHTHIFASPPPAPTKPQTLQPHNTHSSRRLLLFYTSVAQSRSESSSFTALALNKPSFLLLQSGPPSPWSLPHKVHSNKLCTTVRGDQRCPTQDTGAPSHLPLHRADGRPCYCTRLSYCCPHCASSLRVPSLRPLFLCHLSSVTGLVKNPRVDLRWRRPGRRLRRGACLRLHARVRPPAALPPPGRLLHHDHGVSALRHLCTRAPPSYSPHTARSQLECKLVKWEAEGSLMAMYSKVRVSSGGGRTECVR